MSRLENLTLNTSNVHKLQEYRRLGLKGLRSTGVDLPEPDSDPLTVIRSKASQLGENVLVEDTSLDVEGADVGVNVKWLLGNLDKFEGKSASVTVLLGVLRNGVVEVYRGSVPGTIVAPRGSGFGFDSVFLPDGSNKTLGEDKPDRHNARALAVRNFLRERSYKTLSPLPNWEGPWQGGFGPEKKGSLNPLGRELLLKFPELASDPASLQEVTPRVRNASPLAVARRYAASRNPVASAIEGCKIAEAVLREVINSPDFPERLYPRGKSLLMDLTRHRKIISTISQGRSASQRDPFERSLRQAVLGVFAAEDNLARAAKDGSPEEARMLLRFSKDSAVLRKRLSDFQKEVSEALSSPLWSSAKSWVRGLSVPKLKP